MKSLVIMDKHPLLIYGLEGILKQQTDFDVFTTPSTNVLEVLKNKKIDVIITGFRCLSNESYIESLLKLKKIRDENPGLKIILLTSQYCNLILDKAIRAGVNAVVSKEDKPEEIVKASKEIFEKEKVFLSRLISSSIKQEHDGYIHIKVNKLTLKELEVVRLIAEGKTLSYIASKLHRSVSTISTQKYNAMRKLGIRTNNDLYKFAYTHDLLF